MNDETDSTETKQEDPQTLPSLPIGSGFSMIPQNFAEAKEFAQMLAKSSLVPKEFREKPADCLVAVQMGLDLGLRPMQALQNIAVINGRPSMWGDAVLAVVRGSGLLQSIEEFVSEDGKEAVCRVKRHGEAVTERRFSVDDAKLAKLWTKEGPWTQYPRRMLQMRARQWILRDVFPDVLRGMAIREVAQDADFIDGETESVATLNESIKRTSPKAKPSTSTPLTSFIRAKFEEARDEAALREAKAQLAEVTNQKDRKELIAAMEAAEKRLLKARWGEGEPS